MARYVYEIVAVGGHAHDYVHLASARQGPRCLALGLNKRGGGWTASLLRRDQKRRLVVLLYTMVPTRHINQCHEQHRRHFTLPIVWQ